MNKIKVSHFSSSLFKFPIDFAKPTWIRYLDLLNFLKDYTATQLLYFQNIFS
jgi:hypothetical protein